MLQPDGQSLADPSGRSRPGASVRPTAYWREAADCILVLRASRNGLVLHEVNPAAEAALGRTSDDLSDRLVDDVLPAVFARMVDARCKECLDRGCAMTTVEPVSLGARHNGCELTLTPMHRASGRVFLIVATVRDVAVASLSRETPPDENGQALAIRADERRRIGLELHDSTSQHLAALGLDLATLRRVGRDDPAAGKIIDGMSATLEEAAKELRVLTYLMSPPMLEGDGLQPAVRRFVRGFGVRTGLRVRFECRGRMDEFSTELQHAALRVVQEALANVHKHAGATSVVVELVNCRGELAVRISDDGQGMTPEPTGGKAYDHVGLGIPGMRLRVTELGGDLEIQDNGKGCTICARIPRRRSMRSSIEYAPGERGSWEEPTEPGGRSPADGPRRRPPRFQARAGSDCA